MENKDMLREMVRIGKKAERAKAKQVLLLAQVLSPITGEGIRIMPTDYIGKGQIYLMVSDDIYAALQAEIKRVNKKASKPEKGGV